MIFAKGDCQGANTCLTEVSNGSFVTWSSQQEIKRCAAEAEVSRA